MKTQPTKADIALQRLKRYFKQHPDTKFVAFSYTREKRKKK